MTEPQPDTAERVRRRRNPIVTVLAFAFIVFIVICCVLAVVVRTQGSSDGPARTTAPSVTGADPSGPGITSDDPAFRGFATPTTDRFGRRVDIPKWPGGWALPQQPRTSEGTWAADIPTPAPAGIIWEKVNDGAIVAFSTSDGPRRVAAGQAFGFAHTPQGAALAGWQITMRLGAANNDLARTIYDTQTVMTDAQRREVYAQLTAEGPWYRDMADAELSYLTQADAFRITSYAPDFAVVEYATRAPDSSTDNAQQWTTSRVELLWDDDGEDWKLQFPSTDQDPTGHTATLQGWTTW